MHRFAHPVARIAVLTLALVVGLSFAALAADTHKTNKFSGAKVNSGTATHVRDQHHNRLTLSDDFEVPDTPDPHWQVVDSKGRAYLLNRLEIKDGKFNKTIDVPDYVPSIAKVQIWCAWAEVVLGEASFSSPVG